MKQVFLAKYKNGLMGPTKVFADDYADAFKAAYAAFAFNSTPKYPAWRIEDVVECVEPDPDQVMDGPCVQPCSQLRPGPSATASEGESGREAAPDAPDAV